MNEKIPTCIKCSREADFEGPEDFCQFHWLQWWNQGAGGYTFVDNDERLAKEKVLLRLIDQDNPEDHELMETLIEDYFRWLKEDDDAAGDVVLPPNVEDLLQKLENNELPLTNSLVQELLQGLEE